MRDEEILLEIGKRIKEFRKSKNIKQDEFSRIANLSRQALSKVECGYNGVSEITLRNLIIYFPDFDPIYILTGQQRTLTMTPTEGVEI
jgi:transcriptional regulator with XRE-family HTH domain